MWGHGAKTKASVEKELRRLITRFHHEIFGKGPEEVWVKIHLNVATFCCAKSLAPLEEYLLGVPGGEEEVLRLRQKIMGFANPRLCSEIERFSGVQVLRLTVDLCLKSNTMFGAVLFQQALEENGPQRTGQGR